MGGGAHHGFIFSLLFTSSKRAQQVERNVAVEDYTPLLGLVAELRDKIIGLTPRRRDLAAETCEAMDVELLEQMMTHGAFDVVSSLLFCAL